MSPTDQPQTTCLKADLAHALGLASKAVAHKSTLPVLSHLLLRTAGETRLQVTGTNLELAITTRCSAHNAGDWALTLPAKTFTDLVASLPDETITFTYHNQSQTVTIKSGVFVTTLKGLSADEFPVVPAVGTEGFDLPGDLLADALRRVLFATGDDDRPVLAGVFLASANQLLTFVAADGFRLAEYKLPVTLPEFAIIIPAAACLKLLPHLNVDYPAHLVLLKNEDGKITQLGVRSGATELVTQLVEGTYPDYTSILPQTSLLQARFPVAELRQACKTADIIARDSAHTLRLTVQAEADHQKAGFQPAGLALFSTSAELGEHRSFIPAQVDGPALDIAFNARYLLEALTVLGADQAAFSFNTALSPGVLRPIGQDNYQVILMPMSAGK